MSGESGQRAIAKVAADGCAAGAAIASVNAALGGLGLASLVFGHPSAPASWAWWSVACLGIAGVWYGFRLRFDARVFLSLAGALGEDGTVASRAADFDAALDAVAAKTRARDPQRTLVDRARGARRLLARLVAATAAQIGLALFAAWP